MLGVAAGTAGVGGGEGDVTGRSTNAAGAGTEGLANERAKSKFVIARSIDCVATTPPSDAEIIPPPL